MIRRFGTILVLIGLSCLIGIAVSGCALFEKFEHKSEACQNLCGGPAFVDYMEADGACYCRNLQQQTAKKK